MIAAVVVTAACAKHEPSHDIMMIPAHAEESRVSSASAPPETGPVLVAGISFDVPGSWRRETPSSPMRAAQFVIPGDGNEKDGSVAVYYFGGGQGGGAAENAKRWQEQFSDASGRPGRGTVESAERNGLKVTVVTASGTYASGMPMGPSTPEAGFSLWGAIIEGPQGNVFVKATGPSPVIARAQRDFGSLLASLHNASRSM
jgi:hypothetical protein